MPYAAKSNMPKRKRQRIDNRPSAAERGYDADWKRARDKKLRRNPWCEDCQQEGKRRVRAVEVDHIIPFTSLDDPLRLDQGNLRSLCKSHHVRKTWRDRKRGRAGKSRRR